MGVPVTLKSRATSLFTAQRMFTVLSGDVNVGFSPVIVSFTVLDAADNELTALNVMGRFFAEIVGVPLSEAVPLSGSFVKARPKSSRLLTPSLASSESETAQVIVIGFVPVARILVSSYSSPTCARDSEAVSFGATPATLSVIFASEVPASFVALSVSV